MSSGEQQQRRSVFEVSPWRTLGGLFKDEEASAAVEFIVLIPVYILLMIGLFMICNLVLIRQQVVHVARFQAWFHDASPTEAQLDSAFFGPYEGKLTPGTRSPSMVSVSWGDVSADDLQLEGNESTVAGVSGSEAARQIGASALNNVSDKLLKRVEVEVSYEYQGLVIDGLGAITQSSQCSVLLANSKDRKEYSASGSPPHPALDWKSQGGQKSSQKYYDPTQPENKPLSPNFQKSANEFMIQKIWEKDARIGGQVQMEWNYYEDKDKG